ncbi:MAG TPA: hypothetical protein H9708_00595 [Candidatus Borkfalkia stercoripullorum]|mgnify:CR=1 FL=1|nr:hypothetical protein [Candidatus Borkfalkia stercoripullorum]
MDINDLLYRAFRDYRKNTQDDRDCEKRRRVLARVGTEDLIEVDETECEIDDDWIEAIEQGLVHIGRAIEEERQFIRSNGEVVPIEKVKSVSRESSEHLARHGELITRKQADDLIPDKLYTVERLSDYAVYENRFLYMLLCYLRDFISYRYGKITEYANAYCGRLDIRKTADAGERRTEVCIQLRDVRKNDPLARERSGVKEKLARIDGALKTVHLLLSTPLMQELAKVPVLKPPVTETNVLKMDKNFKGAMRLYYFLVSYDKDGFTVRQNTRRISPFPEAIADEFSEAEELLAFLAYAHGMKIEDDLRRAYEEEEARRKREEAKKREERFKNLQKRIRASGKSAEEYMLYLEERCRAFDKTASALEEARGRIERLLAEASEAEKREAALELALSDSRRAFGEAEAAHAEEKAKLSEEHQKEISDLESRHEEAFRTAEQRHSGEIAALRLEGERERAEREEAFAEQAARLQEAVGAAEEKFALSEKQREEAESAAARLEEERDLARARVNALKSEYGAFAPEEDFTAREQFDEIERQYRIFRDFFKKEWRKAKKRIRKEALAKAIPGKDGKSGAGKEDGNSGES